MRYGFSEDRARTRRRGKIIRGVIKWTFLLIVFGTIGYFAYQGGLALAQRDVVVLRQQVSELTTQRDTIEREKSRVDAELARVTGEAAEWRRRYETEVPTGPAADVLKLARERTASGVTLARIAEVVGMAQNKRSCEGKPDSRRFIVRLNAQRVANDSAGFADRLITVTAQGTPAGEPDRPLSWFDPTKPVTITFVRSGGQPSVATGVLPVHHSIVVNDTEHRFVATQGDARGFMTVTWESCAYP